MANIARCRVSVQCLLLVAAITLGGCRKQATSEPLPIDVHVHLTQEAHLPVLLEVLDHHGIDRVVIMASPHLTPGQSIPGLGGYREANELVLAAAAKHPKRLLPFITMDMGVTSAEELRDWVNRGACGVKLYQGHHALHERPLDHTSHHPALAYLAEAQIPVLFHVNTVRYRDELARVLHRFPGLRMVCPHFCGSRSNLDRLEGLLREFPDLLVDTSQGQGGHGVAGLAHLEAERERVRRMIMGAPTRFLFGTDVVTNLVVPAERERWNMHVTANLSFLRQDSFSYWRKQENTAAASIGTYKGLALPRETLRAVLGDNARRWLARCLPAAQPAPRG